MTALLLLQKDLRVLRRSPVLLVVLLAYPLLVAGLVGLVAGYASSKPRVAIVVEDNLPRTLVLGGHRLHVDSTIKRASRSCSRRRTADSRRE
jgi:ABC-2 type transport system permease protein